MKFKEFRNFVNERWADGCWGPLEAMYLIDVGREINKKHKFFKEKAWQNHPEREKCEAVVKELQNKINERYK